MVDDQMPRSSAGLCRAAASFRARGAGSCRGLSSHTRGRRTLDLALQQQADRLDMQRHLQHDLPAWLARASPAVAGILNDAMSGRDITPAEATALLRARGDDAHASLAVADELRRRSVGDDVTLLPRRMLVLSTVLMEIFCTVLVDQGAGSHPLEQVRGESKHQLHKRYARMRIRAASLDMIA